MPPPRAPGQLHILSAVRLTAPPDARLGTVVGLTRTDSGAIIAVTDRGYWIRVPSSDDAGRAPQSGPVAVTIRDLPGPPAQMTIASWSGPGGFDGIVVVLAVAGQATLLHYAVGGCFPNAPAWPGPRMRPGESVARLEPAADGPGRVLVRLGDGSVRERSLTDLGAGRGEPKDVTPLVRDATASARIELSEGCDELTFHRAQGVTLVRTSCSPGFLASLREMWARPQRPHRQPLPIAGIRDIGRIDAPIVAVSEARYAWPHPLPDAVPRGDRADPGVRCSFLLAAQESAGAPIFLYVVQSRCAYYPRDPSGAPFPPPPPP